MPIPTKNYNKNGQLNFNQIQDMMTKDNYIGHPLESSFSNFFEEEGFFKSYGMHGYDYPL